MPKDSPSFDEQLEAKTTAVADKLDADVVFFCGDIFLKEDRKLCSLIRHPTRARRPNVLLMLNTFGGNPDSAYRIARCLQEVYSEGVFFLFVPLICKSAGTLIATGADVIIMADGAEFGPLDVQRIHRDVAGRTSGLTPTQALSTLREEVSRAFEEVFLNIRRRTRLDSTTAAEVAGNIVTGLYSPIYGKFDPVNLGENERALLIAEEYGARLGKGRGGPLRRKAIQQLILGYPSHEFVIDRSEAKDVFDVLRSPTAEETDLADFLEFIVDDVLFNDDAESESIINILNFHIEEPNTTNQSNNNGQTAEQPNNEQQGAETSDGEAASEDVEPPQSHEETTEGSAEAPGTA